MSVSASSSIVADATNTKTTSKTTDSMSEAQDRFLKLLVAQMQNQDPMNPMDNAQVTTQMAQISTVTGIEKLNQTMATLNEAYSASQTMQSASMIGHSVLAEGDVMQLSGGSAIAGVELAEAADRVEISVYDSGGTLVSTNKLGGRDAGNFAFQWDGKKDDGTTAVDGKYYFAVKATSGGERVESTSLAVGKVNSVTLTGSGSLLNVEGLGSVDMSKVRQIL
jgi:flagellar basal-body rod modification protein FlgD